MYLQKQLARDFPGTVRMSGAEIRAAGLVEQITGDRWQVRARVRGARVYTVEMWRQGAEFHTHCSCPRYEDEALCEHVWAAILAADEKGYLRGAAGESELRLA